MVILITISLVVLVWRFTYQEPEETFKPKLPTEGIINIHEHISQVYLGEKWLEAMEQCGVSTTAMMGSPEALLI